MIVLTHNVPDDPEETFKFAEKLKEKGVEMITIVIHTEKKPTDINEQYKALSSSPGSAHSFDYDSMLQKTNDIILNICELNACPKGRSRNFARNFDYNIIDVVMVAWYTILCAFSSCFTQKNFLSP